ncbi:MAG: MFS transporter [Longimicrobiales bacterium]|jgi:UMF1 family MFS transporter
MTEPAEAAQGFWKTVFTKPVMSWALYDLANTIFSMNIVSLYLALWVLDMGGTDATWGYANSLAMLLVFVSAPILGALSDQAGRRLPFLKLCTVACVICTAALGVGGLWVTLGFFVVANYFFQASLIFYDATLSVVSTPKTKGVVGGFGVGIGYLGSFIGVVTGLVLLDRIGHVGIFRVTALLFAFFAIPIFIYVKETGVHTKVRLTVKTAGKALSQVKDTLRHLPRYRGLGRFLLGRVFYTDAANTVIIFLGIYTQEEAGFDTTGTQLLMLAAIVSAVLGGLILGSVVDRIGPKRTLNFVLGLWTVALVGAVAIPVFGLPVATFWAVACVAGVALGGTWTADRPYMLILAPPRRLGEFYGLYSMVGRFAAIIGPAMFALVSHTLGWGRPAAMGSLLVWILIAWVILRKVTDEERDWGPEDLLPPEVAG